MGKLGSKEQGTSPVRSLGLTRKPILMTKSIHLAIAAFLCVATQAQYNQKGTIHLALGTAFGAHGTEYSWTATQTVNFFGTNFTFTDSGTDTDGAATVTIPIEMDFGVTNRFSMGFFLEPGFYLDSSNTESNSMVLVGLQPRFYLINGDRFALLAGAQLGASGLKIERSESNTVLGVTTTTESSASYAGSGLGLGTAAVFQFGDLINLQAHLRYVATNMKLRDYTVNGDDIDDDAYEATLRTRGMAFQLSLGFRF